MELFREDGCMTDAGFRAMMDGRLDELGRLEAAEHLAKKMLAEQIRQERRSEDGIVS